MPKKSKSNHASLPSAASAVARLQPYADGERPVLVLLDNPAIRAEFAALCEWFARLAADYEARVAQARRNSAYGASGGRPKAANRCPCGKFTAIYAARRKHRCEAKPEAK